MSAQLAAAVWRYHHAVARSGKPPEELPPAALAHLDALYVDALRLAHDIVHPGCEHDATVCDIAAPPSAYAS